MYLLNKPSRTDTEHRTTKQGATFGVYSWSDSHFTVSYYERVKQFHPFIFHISHHQCFYRHWMCFIYFHFIGIYDPFTSTMEYTFFSSFDFPRMCSDASGKQC